MSMIISIEARDVDLDSVHEGDFGLLTMGFRGELRADGYRPITASFYLHGTHDERVALVKAMATALGLTVPEPAEIVDDFGHAVAVPA